jgi:hypothetical protein
MPPVKPPQVLGIMVLGLVAVLSLLPEPFKHSTRTLGIAHDCAHFLAFFLSFMLLAFPSKTFKYVSIGSLALIAFGIALELMQTRRYGIQLEYYDIGSDALGILLGVVFWIGRACLIFRQ